MKTNMDKIDQDLKPVPKKYFYVNPSRSSSNRKDYLSAKSLGNKSSALVSSMRGFTTRQEVKKVPSNIFELIKQLKKRKSLNLHIAICPDD